MHQAVSVARSSLGNQREHRQNLIKRYRSILILTAPPEQMKKPEMSSKEETLKERNQRLVKYVERLWGKQRYTYVSRRRFYKNKSNWSAFAESEHLN